MFQTEGRCTTLLTLSQSCSRIMDTQENDPYLAVVCERSSLDLFPCSLWEIKYTN